MNNYAPQQTNYPSSNSQPMPSPTPSLDFEVWGATDKGLQREGNEDAVYPHSGVNEDVFQPDNQRLQQQGHLLIVADGVGGARAGSQASRWAIRVAVETYYEMSGQDPGEGLRRAIKKANASLYQYLQSTGTQEAGSTMTAAVIRNNQLFIANVGDSRAYLLRNGQITQLTRDHTLTQQKLDRGLIQPSQVEMDPDRSVLTRSMGAAPNVQVDVFPEQQLAPGDILLLCSDGLTDMLDDSEIAQIARKNSPKRATKRLIKAANKNGGFDNISVVIARMEGKGAGGAGLLSKLGGLKEVTQDLSKRQKVILGGIGGLVAVMLCGMAGLGWSMYGPRNGQPTLTPDVSPTVNSQATPTEDPPASVSTAQPTPKASVTPAPGGVTSTPRPTLTPTNTAPPPPDSDGDGIPDHKDECSDTFGIAKFNGCPDNDDDGIPHPDDQCPETPGDFEGCPDSDGDGLPDHQDNCPQQPGPRENGGCPVDPDDGGGGNGGDGGNGGNGGDGGDGDDKPSR